MKTLPRGAKEKLAAHKWKAEKHGHYVEPFWVSRRLFDVEKFSGAILDPCCGWGRIVQTARSAGHVADGYDIIDHWQETGIGAGVSIDFLTGNQRPISNIVCNPPYHILREFTERALEVATRKVAMIWLTRRLNAAHWLRKTPLVRIYLLTPRPSMPPGHVVKWYLKRGKEPAGGTQDFCWLVWDQAACKSGSPTVHWLTRAPHE